MKRLCRHPGVGPEKKTPSICEALPLGSSLVFQEAVVSSRSDVGAKTSPEATPLPTGAGSSNQNQDPKPSASVLTPTRPAQTQPGRPGSTQTQPSPRLHRRCSIFSAGGRISSPLWSRLLLVPSPPLGELATQPGFERVPGFFQVRRPRSFTSPFMSEIWCHRGN